MKRKLFVFILLCFMLILTGCEKEKNVKGTLPDLMAKVYEGIKEDELPMGLTDIEVTEENVEGFLGTSKISYKEALAHESMIGSIAHSVVLVRANNNKEVEKLKETIEKNINPRKWVCVGVEEDDVIIESIGDLVIVILVENESVREKIEERFEALETL